MNLIQTIGESYVMTPSDWRSVLSMVLSSAQYTVWASEYEVLMIVQVMENIASGLGIGDNELLDQDNYATGGSASGATESSIYASHRFNFPGLAKGARSWPSRNVFRINSTGISGTLCSILRSVTTCCYERN